MDIAEVQTAEGKLYLFVAIDRTSKFAVTQLIDKADRRTAWEFLEHLLETVRMNRTIKDATVKRFHYDSHDELRTHLFFTSVSLMKRTLTQNEGSGRGNVTGETAKSSPSSTATSTPCETASSVVSQSSNTADDWPHDMTRPPTASSASSSPHQSDCGSGTSSTPPRPDLILQ